MISQKENNKTFDSFADDYQSHVQRALPIFLSGTEIYAFVKATRILSYARSIDTWGETLKVLDVGCGVGLTDELIKGSLPVISGIDISSRSIELARKRNPELNYAVYDGMSFPYPESSFHLVFASCVMHHISPEQWSQSMEGMCRLLKPGGLLLIIEHNPLNPVTRWIVSRCELDRHATLMPARTAELLLKQAGFNRVTNEFFLFLPLRSKTWLWFESKVLRMVPLGAQYISCGVK